MTDVLAITLNFVLRSGVLRHVSDALSFVEVTYYLSVLLLPD